MNELYILSAAAFFAGIVDAVVGGGGLIQIPALFSTLSQTAPATLLGTNKLASMWGTGLAALTYARRVKVEWNTAVPAALSAFIFSFAGAYTVSHLSPDFLRKLLPVILVLVAIYTFKKKDLGLEHRPRHSGSREKVLAVTVGGGIGFYDGFFGPGTGSFLVFLFVRFFGFNFLGASLVAKVVNFFCNLAALSWFGFSGHVLLQVGIVMALFNLVGAFFGTKLALRHGSDFVRKIFLLVVTALIAKTGYDAFF